MGDSNDGVGVTLIGLIGKLDPFSADGEADWSLELASSFTLIGGGATIPLSILKRVYQPL